MYLPIGSMVPLYHLAGQSVGEDDDTKDSIPIKRFNFLLGSISELDATVLLLHGPKIQLSNGQIIRAVGISAMNAFWHIWLADTYYYSLDSAAAWDNQSMKKNQNANMRCESVQSSNMVSVMSNTSGRCVH